MSPRNIIATSTGKLRAVCAYCGRQSRPVQSNKNGNPDLFELAIGWSVAPYPAGHKHADGSLGSLYTCRPCGERRDYPIAPKLDR